MKKLLVLFLIIFGVTVYFNQNAVVTWGKIWHGFGPNRAVHLTDTQYGAYGINGVNTETGKKTFIPWNSIAWTVED